MHTKFWPENIKRKKTFQRPRSRWKILSKWLFQI